MRVGNLDGRVTLFFDGRAVDIAKASDGAYGPDPQQVYDNWDGFRSWSGTAKLPAGRDYDPMRLGPPVPAPRQVFAIGLNYREHAAESGFAAPQGEPPVFTKFPTCLTGPYTEVAVPADGQVDWEVELVVVIGRTAHQVALADAMDVVAGYTVGQDISERRLQSAAAPPQFSLGKSLPGFGPTGPWLVSLDDIEDPDDLALGCAIDGETVQDGRTRDLIFSVPQLVSKLSASVTLLPGDLIFTGTPSGVGLGRKPQRFLTPGEELTSRIAGIGELRQRFVAARA